MNLRLDNEEKLNFGLSKNDKSFVSIHKLMNMKVEVKQWGNSKAIRLPKDFISSMNLDTGDFLEFKKIDEQTIEMVIIPNKSKKTKRLTLEERIAMSSSKQLSILQEWDSLTPTGQEI